ncbi:MAG: hypothetical protein V2I25_01190 [Woeseiaceae bacterium]|nr:hypothetical protein [Woeseiaceae bacterium]
MNNHSLRIFALLLAVTLTTTVEADPDAGKGYRWIPVSGTGTHYFTTALVHSKEPTATGFVQRSTDIVELEGDLEGRVLYHPVSVFDFAAGTLVNTGHQVFSGTVLGSEPVLIYDDEFRFEVQLATGETVGRIFLTRPMAGPRIYCELEVDGTGMTPGGDARVAYTGRCKVKQK